MRAGAWKGITYRDRDSIIRTRSALLRPLAISAGGARSLLSKRGTKERMQADRPSCHALRNNRHSRSSTDGEGGEKKGVHLSIWEPGDPKLMWGTGPMKRQYLIKPRRGGEPSICRTALGQYFLDARRLQKNGRQPLLTKNKKKGEYS